MLFKSGISDLVDLYDYFIFDVWGVVHDGRETYPGVIEAISLIRKKGKKICFLSNAPRRAARVEDVLNKFGVTRNLYDFVLTSGEATFLDLQKNQENNFSKFGKKYFYIGPKKDIDLLHGLNYQMSQNPADADFAITTGFDHDESVLQEKMPQAIEARKYNLPMICVNPDMIVVKQDGHEMICAGALALEYKNLGGDVIYYGKPFLSVYEMVCELFKSRDKSKMIAFGDGLETDVKGANDFGIDCALLTGGILSNKLGVRFGEVADEKKLRAICESIDTFPTFVLSKL